MNQTFIRFDRRRWFLLVILLTGSLLPLLAPAAVKPPTPPPLFEKDVLPILQARCFQCHGPQKQKAGLDLRTRAAILMGGETGPAMVPGAAQTSLLWEKVSANKMPPGKDKLTAAEKAVLRAWIEGGARDSGTTAQPAEQADRQVTDVDRQFWAFQ